MLDSQDRWIGNTLTQLVILAWLLGVILGKVHLDLTINALTVIDALITSIGASRCDRWR
jgi:hypothetical protein